MQRPSRLAKEHALRSIRNDHIVIPEGDESEVEGCSDDEQGELELGDYEIIDLGNILEDADIMEGLFEAVLAEDVQENVADAAVPEIRWRKQELLGNRGAPFADTNVDLDMDMPAIYEEKSLYEIGKLFMTDELLNLIVQQTNQYSVQLTGTSVNVTREEIEKFIGMLLLMAVYGLPQYRMYWTKATEVPRITNAMPINRFDAIKRFLHFNDNSVCPARDSPEYDKLYKVRPLISHMQRACRSLPQTESQSVDEQIIPTKGRSPIRQYLPMKPNKWGIKIWARCAVTGMLLDFEVYTGKGGNPPTACGVGGDVVLRLCDSLPDHVSNVKLYFDNYFTSIELLLKLAERRIWATGTIRKNRTKGCDKVLESEKDLKKRGRGSFDWRADQANGVLVVRWMDSGIVQLASNYATPERGAPCQRFNAQQKTKVDVPCPQIVHSYNRHMGGVDLCDMLMSLYRVTHRSRKWYHHIFFYSLNLMIVNSWLIYRQIEDRKGIPKRQQLSLLKFHTDVAESFLLLNKGEGRNKRRSYGGAAGDGPQRDGVGHWPVFLDAQQKCRLCMDNKKTKIGRTMYKCSKCDVNLCLGKERNCFMIYHMS